MRHISKQVAEKYRKYGREGGRKKTFFGKFMPQMNR